MAISRENFKRGLASFIDQGLLARMAGWRGLWIPVAQSNDGVGLLLLYPACLVSQSIGLATVHSELDGPALVGSIGALAMFLCPKYLQVKFTDGRSG